jgi:hypothetical protein
MSGRAEKLKPAISPQVFRHEEELARWREEYLEIRNLLEDMDPLKNAENAGGASTPGAERRAEPRYAFREGAQIFAHLGPKAFQIINISIGGVAFFSDVAFEPNTKLLLSALGMIALDVEILDCEMEEVDASMMEYRYRVRARFGPRVNGYQVYVLAREMYLQQTQEGDGILQADLVGPPKPEPGP